jgi:hypothetical protein
VQPPEISASDFKNDLVGRLHLQDSGLLAAIAYQIGEKGEWRHFADVQPGDVDVRLTTEHFEGVEPGIPHPLRFRAFNGVDHSEVTDPVAVAINRPPVLVDNPVEALPAIPICGKRAVELPFRAIDDDGDPVKLHYKFNSETKWREAPEGELPHVFPAERFAHLPRGKAHEIHVCAFDGIDVSEPLTIPINLVEEDKEEGFFGGLSQGAFFGIVAAGLAVLAVGIGLVVVAVRRRKPKESSSTGLIDNEE